MITPLTHSVPLDLLDQAENYFFDDFRISLNYPMGNFFYDQWILKQKFKGTIWEQILSTLPSNEIGEARLISLKPNTCYHSHSDIDDRYHLTIRGHYSYLVDLDSDLLYPTEKNGVWYLMDAGPRHSAVNFGVHDRLQLVVRKLLPRNNLKNPVSIKLKSRLSNPEDTRFLFDDKISQWLNRAIKNGIIDNFSQENHTVKFDIEENRLKDFNTMLPKEFYYD